MSFRRIGCRDGTTAAAYVPPPRPLRLYWDTDDSCLQLYLKYAQCMVYIPQLVIESATHSLDQREKQELEALASAVPSLLENLPKIFEYRTEIRQRVCLTEMLSGLLGLVRPLRMYGIVSSSKALLHCVLMLTCGSCS